MFKLENGRIFILFTLFSVRMRIPFSSGASYCYSPSFFPLSRTKSRKRGSDLAQGGLSLKAAGLGLEERRGSAVTSFFGWAVEVCLENRCLLYTSDAADE